MGEPYREAALLCKQMLRKYIMLANASGGERGAAGTKVLHWLTLRAYIFMFTPAVHKISYSIE
jgi:hypothetical protein